MLVEEIEFFIRNADDFSTLCHIHDMIYNLLCIGSLRSAEFDHLCSLIGLRSCYLIIRDR